MAGFSGQNIGLQNGDAEMGEDVRGSKPAQASSAALPGRSDMFRSLKDLDRQPDLGKADRLFSLAINGQRFEDI